MDPIPECTCMEDECNHCWNEHVFNRLGLHAVWKMNGHWIPDHERYPEGWTQLLDWYTYCDTFNIPWIGPMNLPNWAIEMMDQFHREEYYQDTGIHMLTEENWSKYTCTDPILALDVAVL